MQAHLSRVVKEYGEELINMSNKNIPKGVYPFHYDGEWNRNFDENNVKGKIIYDRYTKVLALLDSTAKHFERRLPKTTLFIDLNENSNLGELEFPICSISSNNDFPSSTFLFPDWEYQCHIVNDECYDWNAQKVLAEEHISDKLKKKQVMYYRSDRQTNINKAIEKIVEDNPLFDVKVSSSKKKYEIEPFYEKHKYSYLLSLPERGVSDFKQLFLCNSLVIKVNDERREFLDLIVKGGEDYLEVPLRERSFEQDIKLVEKLERIADRNPRSFNKIKQSGYEKVTSITNATIYKYIKNLIYANNKLIRASVYQ